MQIMTYPLIHDGYQTFLIELLGGSCQMEILIFASISEKRVFLMEALNIPMGGQIWQILPDIVRLTFHAS